MFRSLALPALLLATSACLAADPVPVTDFASGPGNGTYSFASSNPPTVMELLNKGRPRPSATGQGELLLPANAPAGRKLAAVVLVPGSGGVYPELTSFWAARLNQAGMAVFILDVFGPRGVKSTAEDQSRVPFSADLADAFVALGLLASHPRIDPAKIAVMGFSRGAMASVRSNVTRIAAGTATGSARFAAHVSLYSGGCTGYTAVTAKPGAFGPAPMLFIHGEDDDYTYASDCRDYAKRISAAGTPADFVLLAGARHKFDMDDPKRVNLPAVTKAREGCPLEFDVVDLTMRDRRSGAALNQEKAAALNRELCSDKGATIEGDRKARESAGMAVLDFLAKTLKP